MIYFYGAMISFVAMYFFTFIRDPLARQVYSTLVGFTVTLCCFGTSSIVSLAMNLFCYLMFRIAPTKNLGTIVFVIQGIVLSTAQIHKQVFYNGKNGLEMTMTLMFSYCKNTSLACNIADGYNITQAKKTDKVANLKPREV